MKTRIFKMMFLACIILFTGFGCTTEESDKLPYDAFVVSPAGGMTFAYEVFEKQIQITANTDWTVKTEDKAEWLTIMSNKGLITLTATPNETSTLRTTNLVFERNGLDPVVYPIRSLPINRAKDNISIITYNVKDGFAGRNSTVPNNTGVLNRFRDFVKVQNPDIICYQELKEYTSETFKSFVEGLAIGHAYVEFYAVSSGHNLGISSKYPITDPMKTQSGLTNGLMVVSCCNAGIGITQLDENTENKRVQESTTIIESMKSYSVLRSLDGTIVLGDMHTLSTYDKGVYGNDKDYNALNNFNANNYKGIYEILKTLPGENTTNFTDNNFRYDHILVSSGLQNSCVSYGVITDTPTPNISDHFPVKTVIQVTKFK